jgi:hypothetical protein
MKVISNVLIRSVSDEGYFNVLIRSVSDEGHFQCFD